MDVATVTPTAPIAPTAPTASTHYDRAPLSTALRILAGRCNYARNLDGAGFSKFDADFGHKLAEMDPAQWSPKMLHAAYKIARKYRGQLANAGHPFDAIPEPPPLEQLLAPSARSAKRRVIRYDGQHYVCEFPYDPQLVDGIKKVPGARFSRTPAPCWTVPPTPDAKALLRGLAELWLFEVEESARPSLMNAVAAASPADLRRCDVHPSDAERLIVTFPYEEELSAEARRYGTFESKDKRWSVPIVRRGTIEEFRGFLHDWGFKITPEAIARIEAVLAIREQSLELSRAVSAAFEIPGLALTPFPFQFAGIRYALDKKRTFIADEMGLGKTIQGIGTMVAADAFPCVVVCPASLKLNWRREWKRWAPHLVTEIVEGMTPHAFGAPLLGTQPDVVIINYDILGAHLEELHKLKLRAVLVDEAHYVKNHAALRTGWVEQLALGIEYVLLLTGTPVLNQPGELKVPLKIMRRLGDVGGSRYFDTRYCRNGGQNLTELNETLRSLCYIRRLKSQVLTELPPKLRTPLALPIDNGPEYQRIEENFLIWVRQKAADDKAFRESIAHLPPDEQARLIAERKNSAVQRALRAEVLVRMESLKQCAVKGMLKAAIAWVRDFLESGEKLVLFATHKDVIRAFAETFKAPTITGDDDAAARQAAVDRFQTDPECKLIALNIQAGGVGLTLTAASNVATVELAWTPGVHDQAEDRCHRIGQKDTVTSWFLLASGTIMERIAAVLDEKRAIVDAATEGGNVVTQSVFADVLKQLTGVEFA